MRGVDLTGRMFTRWTVLHSVQGPRQKAWRCRCACGAVRCVSTDSLLKGKSGSCGCLRAEITSVHKRIHGGSQTVEYATLCHMHSRCYNPNTPYYAEYGGRGITVCSRWSGPDGFTHFLADMGPRPSAKHSIDRFPDNNGNYGPGNCRWATTTEQSVNRRSNVFVEHGGYRGTLSQWAVVTGLPYGLLHRRYWEGCRGERLFREKAA